MNNNSITKIKETNQKYLMGLIGKQIPKKLEKKINNKWIYCNQFISYSSAK